MNNRVQSDFRPPTSDFASPGLQISEPWAKKVLFKSKRRVYICDNTSPLMQRSRLNNIISVVTAIIIIVVVVIIPATHGGGV
jgi:hypothetical protein